MAQSPNHCRALQEKITDIIRIPISKYALNLVDTLGLQSNYLLAFGFYSTFLFWAITTITQDTCISTYLSWYHLIFPSCHLPLISFLPNHLSTPHIPTFNTQHSALSKSTWVFFWLLKPYMLIIELFTFPPTLFLLLRYFLACCHHYSPSLLTQEPESFPSCLPPTK